VTAPTIAYSLVQMVTSNINIGLHIGSFMFYSLQQSPFGIYIILCFVSNFYTSHMSWHEYWIFHSSSLNLY